ncbi:hypothetical protein H0E87_013763 [Populus deltoides]|uniref:Uncharacterized protein n=1 Tax=Populus deltoides TaxID=3696 RepID=A0A8T2YAV0_POPDE|nr:hypothetical protein H0E87_013763 [Populus deltoides]
MGRHLIYTAVSLSVPMTYAHYFCSNPKPRCFHMEYHDYAESENPKPAIEFDKVNEGFEYFKRIEEYDIVPRIEHYVCMVDLLGACTIHGHLGLGAFARAQLLLQLEPKDSGDYVLISNLDNDMKAGAFLVASCMHQGRLERTAGVEPVSVLVACESGECSSMHGRRWQERVQLGPCVQGGCMRYLEETEIDKDTEEESSDYKMERRYLRSAVARLATRRSNRRASGTPCMFPHDFFFVRDYCG